MSFGTRRNPIAQKRYNCVWCHESIEIGERHVQFVGKWEGEFQDFRMHGVCDEAHGRETHDGEICDQRHPMGRTCDEREAEHRKLAKETNEVIEQLLRESGVPGEMIGVVLRRNPGGVIGRDIFAEAFLAEAGRVAELRNNSRQVVREKVSAVEGESQ